MLLHRLAGIVAAAFTAPAVLHLHLLPHLQEGCFVLKVTSMHSSETSGS